MSSTEDKLKELLHANTGMPKCPQNDTSIPIDQFRKWFLEQFNDSNHHRSCCKLDTFAIYFLNNIRKQTEYHLRSIEVEQNQQTSNKAVKLTAVQTDYDACANNIGCVTPKHVPTNQLNSAPSTPNFASTPDQIWKGRSCFENSLGEELQTNLRSTPKGISHAIATSTPSMDRSATSSFHKSETSTPIRRNQNSNRRSGSNSLSLATTPHSAEKSARNHSNSSSFCLGDFMVLQQSNSRSHKKKVATNAQPQQIVDASSSETNSNSHTRPKKRVVPTTISQRSIMGSGGELKPFGGSSSFSNENNILKLTNVEIEDKTKCTIMAARKSLKLNADEISKELETVSIADDEKNLRGMIERKLRDVTAKVDNKTPKAVYNKPPSLPIDFAKIKHPAVVQRLADIYVVLMDLNFVTNVLSEMAFVLNLLNVEDATCDTSQIVTDKNINLDKESSAGIELLSNITNCIYFSLCVLRRQRHMFAQLDLKSLGVVLHNERIQYLDISLKSYLERMFQHKQTLLLDKSQNIDGFATTNDQSFKSVYYQEDKDSRQHFTSNNDFGAFKTQRDLFYKVLKLWETHHPNPNWNFTLELSTKIRDIFKQSENPINMAHFAKLFVAQLLISASDASSPEDIGLDVDAEKFSKLSQRLVAPSNFSVDYQFPRNQAFFRDFIAEARSIPFIEQLKLALYHQLVTLNNSTFEQLNLFNDQRDADDIDTENDKSKINEFIVRPEILASMIILAKFLGFVTAYPYSQSMFSAVTIGTIEKKQLSLRSLFQPHFSVTHHLMDAIKNNKMLITLPWLVQYLAMLDNITLQMNDLEKAIQLLFALSTEIGYNSSSLNLLPVSIFIFRCCIGWLFDTRPLIAEKYFRYRATHAGGFERETQDSSLTIFRAAYCAEANENRNDVIVKLETLLNPILEGLIPVACPFLADFRVAIMPTKYATTKYVSRTGRYRHITTRIAEAAPSATTSPLRAAHSTTNMNAVTPQQSLQNKLTDAFLHSQNASMRRLIEFVTERVYKSVVKDGQHKYIMPSKAAADKLVNEIKSTDAAEVFKTVATIYKQAHEETLQQWDINLPKLLHERITIALKALLPTETSPVIQRIYFKLIEQNAMKRIQQWFEDNLRRNNIYCADLNEITQKICKANKKAEQNAPLSELKIVQLEPCISDLLDELQYWLHCTSLRTELLEAKPDEMIKFFQRIPETFANTLPTIFYRLIGTGIIQLMQHLIIHKPSWLTTQLLGAACAVWLHPKFEHFINTGKPNQKMEKHIYSGKSCKNGSDDDDDDNSNRSSLTDNQKTPSIYDGLITVAFIKALEERSERFEKLKDLLIQLIKNKVITLDKINLLLLPFFKTDYSSNVSQEISKMLQLITVETAQICRTQNNDCDDVSKPHLFMKLETEFSRDVDNLSFN